MMNKLIKQRFWKSLEAFLQILSQKKDTKLKKRRRIISKTPHKHSYQFAADESEGNLCILKLEATNETFKYEAPYQ